MDAAILTKGINMRVTSKQKPFDRNCILKINENRIGDL